MFTGLVEETGELISLEKTGGSARLVVRASVVSKDARVGDSIAVNGCCLTITSLEDGRLEFDLLAETLNRTNLGSLAPGSLVNLERALPAHARLGGHFVQGHIDAACEILSMEKTGADHRLEIALPREFAGYVASKGSIAVDGISLTIAEVHEHSFVVWVIPHTLAATNLGAARLGTRVNIEFDLLAKYVERLLATR